MINTGVDDVTRRWTLRLVVGLAAGAVLLSGCSNQQEANDTLPGADATPSASEAELPPLGPPDLPMPAEARHKTPEGALAFTEYYINLNSYISDGPRDPQPLLELSQDCTHCTQVAQSYLEDRTAGYSYAPLTYTFEGAGPGLLSGTEAQVGFVYSQSQFTVLDKGGEAIQERSAPATGPLQSGALLVWEPSYRSWLVRELTIG